MIFNYYFTLLLKWLERKSIFEVIIFSSIAGFLVSIIVKFILAL